MLTFTGPIHCETSARSLSPLGGSDSSESTCACASDHPNNIVKILTRLNTLNIQHLLVMKSASRNMVLEKYGLAESQHHGSGDDEALYAHPASNGHPLATFFC